VIRFSNQRVQEDILSELARGGQVFFVHNRVQSIGKVAEWLKKLVPEARLQVAHGQMPEDELEAAMLRFVRHEVDVLVCTTIIESGVDLPKVNTMLVNRAEGFGLAQLYQLRGRVGRGDVSARCTLLVSGAALERQKATERLMALQEATTLGSGMTLASRDLEMRGSGDLLGDRQHGSIAAIGFDAYVELLEEAVAVARGQVRVQRVEPEVEVPVPALIPEDYVAELGERLESYRLLSSADSRSEVNGLVKRLEQRHGRLPSEVENLRWLSLCRVGLRELGVQRASVLKIRMILDFHPSSLMPTDALLLLCKQQPGRFRLTAEGMLAVHFTPEEGQQPLRILDWAINRLAELLPGKK
jgi:transcription-repair coupling factor (superfamily II helicase)